MFPEIYILGRIKEDDHHLGKDDEKGFG